MSEADTRALLTEVPASFHGGVDDVLLAGLAIALVRWRSERGVAEASALIRLEGHGREEELVPGADLSRTVGWFTSIYPVLLDLAGIDVAEALSGGAAASEAVKAVKEQLRAIPDRGMGYGLLRYLNPPTAERLSGPLPGQVVFNYLGRVSAADIPEELAGFGWLPAEGPEPWTPRSMRTCPPRRDRDQRHRRRRTAQRRVRLSADPVRRADVRQLAELWTQALAAIVRRMRTPGAGGHTPSDFSLVHLEQPEIQMGTRYGDLADVWPLAPLQQGLLFQAMLAEASVDVYNTQAVLRLADGRPGPTTRRRHRNPRPLPQPARSLRHRQHRRVAPNRASDRGIAVDRCRSQWSER